MGMPMKFSGTRPVTKYRRPQATPIVAPTASCIAPMCPHSQVCCRRGLETEEGHFCWIEQSTGETKRQRVILGESNDVYVIVEQGIKEGEKVLLNPLEFMEETELASADDYRGLGDTSGYADTEATVEEAVSDE